MASTEREINRTTVTFKSMSSDNIAEHAAGGTEGEETWGAGGDVCRKNEIMTKIYQMMKTVGLYFRK